MKLLTTIGLTKLIDLIKSSFIKVEDTIETEETSLKTINGQSILGEGDITISGGASSFADLTGQPTDNANLATALNAKYDTTNPSGYQTAAQVSTAITSATNNFITLGDISATSPISYNNATGKIGVASGYQIPTTTQITQIATNTANISVLNTNKQPTLISGTNIKTINNQSLLGSGNIDIQGGVASSGLLPGQIFFSLDPLSDAGLHLLDGTKLQVGGAYDDFITNYIIPLYTAHPERFKTEAQWQAIYSQYGVCGYYVYDAGVSVRLPKVTGIIESTIDINALGSVVPESLPNIKGEVTVRPALYDVIMSSNGAFTRATGSVGRNRMDVPNPIKPEEILTFNASDSSSIYQDDAHVQPQTIKGYYYIVISTVTKTDIEVDIDEVMTDLNNKVDTSSLLSCQVVIDTYKNGTEGYRIWSDGYCEQWGVANATASSIDNTLSFLKTFSNTNYYINANNNQQHHVTIYAHTTTQAKFGIITAQIGWGTGTIKWKASGYLAEGEYSAKTIKGVQQ